MKFSEAMAALQQASPKFTTELTPINTNVAKKEFLARGGVGAPPNFVYDNSTDYAAGKRQVERLMRKFRHCQFSNAQMEVLNALSCKVQTQYNLLQAIRDYRQAQDCSIARAEQRVCQRVIALYGEPDERTYRALWTKRLQSIEGRFSLLEWSERVPDGISKLFFNLRRRFWSDTALLKAPFAPQRATVTQFAELCQQRWRKIFDRIETDRVYTPEEVRDLLNAILQEDFPYPIHWRAVISENKTSLDTNQITLELEIPRHRGKGPYTGQVVREIIIGHELMVHIARREYAEAYCPDVAVPLPDYIEFEEGLAKAVEQSLGGEFEQTGIEHYLVTGMAYYDQMTFSDVFLTQRAQLFLQDYELNDTIASCQEKWQKAANEAFRLTFRCFRGTGIIPLTNNLVYYNGQMRAWQYIEERIGHPEKLERILFEAGKTDPTNSLHQEMLRNLGWTSMDF